MTNTDPPAPAKKTDTYVRVERIEQASRWAQDAYQGVQPSTAPMPPPTLIGAPVGAAPASPPPPPAPKK